MTSNAAIIDSLSSVEEIRGFAWGVRNIEGARVLSEDDWQRLAHRKVALEREAAQKARRESRKR